MSFLEALRSRILLLDGATGTMIQQARLAESQFRGARFAAWPKPLLGCNDVLALTEPKVIARIARQYIDAGADIISTDTFNANAISLSAYGLEDSAAEINLAAARIAREAADAAPRKVWVAGSIGPTDKTASMSPDVDDPGARAVSYAQLRDAYAVQIAALAEGGVDLLLFETVFDTLNLKAGLDAAASFGLPVMVSLTLAGGGARTFSGQTIEAFLSSVSHYPIATIGLNCSFGATEMAGPLRLLSRIAPWPVSVHPNAGLPDAMGRYADTPARMASLIGEFAAEGLVNIVGGCCGTTPAHIAEIRRAVAPLPPRVWPSAEPRLRLSGLEMLDVDSKDFTVVGERCNVAGSRKFLRLIKEGALGEALAIARRQVEQGADIIDINMDDGLLDSRREMARFLDLLAAEPALARVPVMIDSSDRETIFEALGHVQGKPVVNSISLKEGEARFLEDARMIRRRGAAVVVMAFDEKGQADTFERKVEVCARAYRLLTEQAGFPPEDIIFDPNILAVATGIEAHDRYALDFIRATEWIKTHLPHAKVSGGVSNLSFAFRGHNTLRRAMHSAFLHHARRAGMDMAIIDPASLVSYDEIPSDLRSLIDDLLLCRRPDAAERLTAYAAAHPDAKGASAAPSAKASEAVAATPAQRLAEAMVSGIDDSLDADISALLESGLPAVDIISGPLMEGMNRVGSLFAEGRMFLPQVVKAARTMKRAVEILRPALEASRAAASSTAAGRILIATVKGDVHDIGKNIVAIVMGCTNYEVTDLGVMVPPATIVEAARASRPDIICLSGLITPSLDEMVRTVAALAEADIDTPVMVGGATTSALHTALKIAPATTAPVIHAADAAQNPVLAARLLDPAAREEFLSSLRASQERLRSDYLASTLPPYSPDEARRRHAPYAAAPAPRPRATGVTELCPAVADVVPFINWKMFLHAWRMAGSPDAERASLLDDARALLDSRPDWFDIRCKTLLGEARVCRDSDTVSFFGAELLMPRRLRGGAESCPSLADWIYCGPEPDYMGAFAVAVHTSAPDDADSYTSLLVSTLAHRLAEAASEWLHARVRTSLWGYAPDEALSVADLFAGRFRGIRPAVGYPSLPDQRLNLRLAEVLRPDTIGITLTENGAMHPDASVAGLYIAAPEARYFA